MWLAFFCIFIGMILARRLESWADRAITFGLYILLLAMGINVGSKQEILAAVPGLGLQAILNCLLASFFSIVLVLAWDKAFIRETSTIRRKLSLSGLKREAFFTLGVFGCFILGLIGGKWSSVLSPDAAAIIMKFAFLSIFLGIGVSMRYGLEKFCQKPRAYLRYTILPVLISIGSVVGGLMAGLISGQDLRISAAIGGGMAYYSLATAIITDQAGLHAGLLAFMTNFLRELLTFVLAPFLARFSSVAPIALGAASTMDTTLGVMKQNLSEKFVLLAFINGLILTFLVPLLLFLILGSK